MASLVARHRQDDRDHVWQALVTTTPGVGTVTIAADVPGVPAEGIEWLGASGAVRVDLHSRSPAAARSHLRAYRTARSWCRR